MKFHKKIVIFAIGFALCFLLFVPYVHAAEETTEAKQDEGNNDITQSGIYSGVGLVAVGGVGSVIVFNNKKKKKDVPSKEINADGSED